MIEGVGGLTKGFKKGGEIMTLRELFGAVRDSEYVTVKCGKDSYTVIEFGNKSDIEKKPDNIKYLDWQVYLISAWKYELVIYIE